MVIDVLRVSDYSIRRQGLSKIYYAPAVLYAVSLLIKKKKCYKKNMTSLHLTSEGTD